MTARAVSATAMARQGQMKVQVSGPDPAGWGPMPEAEALDTMRRYVSAHGFPVRLEVTQQDGSKTAHGFSPDGQVVELGVAPAPSMRPAGGLGAAWTPPQQQAEQAQHYQSQAPMAPPERPTPPADAQYRPRRVEALAQPAPVYGPPKVATSWSAPLGEDEQLDLSVPASAQDPAPEASRARRGRAKPKAAAGGPGMFDRLSAMSGGQKKAAGGGLVAVIAGVAFFAVNGGLPV